jgi:hypothetical protein
MYNRTLRMRALRLLRLLIIATAILYVFSPPGPAKYLTPAFADTPHAVDACRDRNLNIVPCGEDSRTGSYAASDRCGASCQHPNVSCGCASCAPDAGYAWVGSGGHDYRVRWAPEIRHPDYPHITAGDTLRDWVADDGYLFTGNGLDVRWHPGLASRSHPHVVAADAEGQWSPEDGYAWANPGDPSSMNVRWTPGLRSRSYPHVFAAAGEGLWSHDKDYIWAHPGKDLSVRSFPAESLIEQKKYEEAVALLKDLIRGNPNALWAHDMLAQAYNGLQDRYWQANDWDRQVPLLEAYVQEINISHDDSYLLTNELRWADHNLQYGALQNYDFKHDLSTMELSRLNLAIRIEKEILEKDTRDVTDIAKELKFNQAVAARITAASAQLPSVRRNSEEARRAAENAPNEPLYVPPGEPGASEMAKNKAACGFDNTGPGCSTDQDRIGLFAKSNNDLPAVAALKNMIPKAAWDRKDPRIAGGVAWFSKLETERAGAKSRLYAVQKQLESGTGDARIFAAEKQTLENEVRRIDADQKTAKKAIEEALKDDSLDWNVEADPVAPKQPPSNQLTPEELRMIERL